MLTSKNINCIKNAGYKFYGINRTTKKGGGTGMLINDQYKFKLRKDLEMNSDVLENSIFELETKNRNIILCSLYRAPNTGDKIFLQDYIKLTDQLNKEQRKNCIIGLDHNLDFLKADLHKNTMKFIESTLDSNLIPVITKPTRITKSSATLIDNIFLSNNLIGHQVSGIVCNDMSDHLLCLVSIENMKCSKREPLQITSRKINDKTIKDLKTSLEKTDWNKIIVGNNVSENFEYFHSKLMDEIN